MVPLLSVWQFCDGLLLIGMRTLGAIQIDAGFSSQHLLQGIRRLAVIFPQGMGINVHGGGGLGMTQPGGDGFDILMGADEQRGGGVPQAVEGDHGQRRVGMTVVVLSDQRL